MPLSNAERLVNLGVVTPLAKELALQAESGEANVQRLVGSGMVPGLAMEVAAQISSGETRVARLGEMGMVPGIAKELATQIQGGGVDPDALLRPLSYIKAIANEGAGTSPLGPSNPWLGGVFHGVAYEDITDGSFQAHWPHMAASAGFGEWSSGGTATVEAVCVWINNAGAVQVTAMTASGGGNVASFEAFKRGKLFGPTIRPKVGSHYWIHFRCYFPNGGYLSHARADYANGEALTYGASVAAPSATPYGNTWNGGGDYYGPCFVGGNCKRPTFGVTGDSNHSGVLVSGAICDIPDTLDGGIGSVARHLVKNMAGIDVSVPGALASEMADPAKTVFRDSLLAQTDVIFPALGTNDMVFNTRTASQVAADIATAKARQKDKLYFYPTVPAVIVSPSNNTAAQPAREAQRNARNTALRASASDLFDIAVGTEAGTTGTLQDPTDTQDGTHFVAKGNKKAATGTGFVVSTKVPGAALVSAGHKYAPGQIYQSLDFSDGWATQQAAQTVKAQYSPEHKVTALLLKEDGSAGSSHNTFKQLALTLASTTKKFSVFAKRVTGTRNLFLQLQRSDNFTDARVSINLGTGVEIGRAAATGFTINSVVITPIEDYFLIEWTVAIAAGVAANPYFYCKLFNGSDTFDGDNASSLALWGFDVR